MEKTCGIYCIENIVNGKKYIGQSDHVIRRIKCQYNELKRMVSERMYLQLDWIEYGEENFNWHILETCINDRNILDELEIFYIKNLKSHVSENGYNVSWGGRKTFEGLHHTDEGKEKLRQNGLGRKPSEESRKKNRESNLGKKNGFYGKKHSEIAKQKMRGGRPTVMGKNNPAYGTSYAQGIKNAKNSSSKYVGVSRRGKKWRSRMHFGNVEIVLGNFITETEAALAYNEAAIEFYGWKAKLNNVSKEEIEKLWND